MLLAPLAGSAGLSLGLGVILLLLVPPGPLVSCRRGTTYQNSGLFFLELAVVLRDLAFQTLSLRAQAGMKHCIFDHSLEMSLWPLKAACQLLSLTFHFLLLLECCRVSI